jgi:serine protease Do
VFGPDLVIRGRGWIADHIPLGLPGTLAGYSGPPARLVPAVTAPTQPAAPPLPAAAATVYVEARWRLYDKGTGQPVYQKVVVRHGQRLPCFVQTTNGRIVPWLTTEDEDHVNSPIGGLLRGSGFIVGSEGSIITSRHVAAGWTARYFQPRVHEVALFRERTDPGLGESFRFIDPGLWQDGAALADWVPGDGGPLFRSRSPVAVGAAEANLEGRNDSLHVLLPSSHASTPARLVLASDKADIAELRIDVGNALPTIPLAGPPAAQPGQAVTAFFYPAPLATGLDQAGPTDDAPAAPHLASTRGTIVATHGPDSGAGTGGLYELSMDPGAAADGGPVIGANGAALGVVTSGPAGDAGHIFASPAGAALALLDSQ